MHFILGKSSELFPSVCSFSLSSRTAGWLAWVFTLLLFLRSIKFWSSANSFLLVPNQQKIFRIFYYLYVHPFKISIVSIPKIRRRTPFSSNPSNMHCFRLLFVALGFAFVSQALPQFPRSDVAGERSVAAANAIPTEDFLLSHFNETSVRDATTGSWNRSLSCMFNHKVLVPACWHWKSCLRRSQLKHFYNLLCYLVSLPSCKVDYEHLL